MSVTADELARVPVLAGLDQEHLAELVDWFEVEEVEVGQRLARQGSSGYAFYVVRAGTFVVDHDGAVVRRLVAGDHFGEISILGSGRRTATVTAEKAGTVLTLFGTRFRELQAASPAVAEALERSMRERLEHDESDRAQESS